MNAQDALNKLKEGNTAYVSDKGSTDTSATKRASLTGGQTPYAIILSCADSRVVPEAIFSADAGDIFVLRVAGNIANTSSIASIEYAVAHLGTKLIVVLGHESCGAVGAALQGGDNGHNLNHLVAHITPAVELATDKEVPTVAKKNAELNCKVLKDNSEIISQALNEGVEIVPAYYNLGSGQVDWL